jgi:hypothetical protein
VEKKEYIGIFCFLRPNVYHATNICISYHAFLVCFKYKCLYKCHIINFLLNSLAHYEYRGISDLGLFVQTSPYGLGLYKKDVGPIFLCTDLAFG